MTERTEEPAVRSVEQIDREIAAYEAENADLDREWDRLDSQSRQEERQRQVGNRMERNGRRIQELKAELATLAEDGAAGSSGPLSGSAPSPPPKG